MIKLFGTVFWITLSVASISSAQSSPSFNDIAASHIDANIPSQDEFDSILKRDLNSYFQKILGRTVETTYEMLRDGPTQTGISYPKYYIWVKVFSETTLLAEGAIRVAATDKVRFEITDFMNKEEIRSNPQAVGTIFPAALVSKIELLSAR